MMNVMRTLPFSSRDQPADGEHLEATVQAVAVNRAVYDPTLTSGRRSIALEARGEEWVGVGPQCARVSGRR
jgi:hypothetical protein